MQTGSEQRLIHYCEGCKCKHYICPDRWAWNGDIFAPTLSPSILHYYTHPEKPNAKIATCHYFITAGKIKYCNDCQHDLKGQTVALCKVDSKGNLV